MSASYQLPSAMGSACRIRRARGARGPSAETAGPPSAASRAAPPPAGASRRSRGCPEPRRTRPPARGGGTTADLVAVPAPRLDPRGPPRVLDARRRAAAGGAYLLSVCPGAFLCGGAGVLEGGGCPTHWISADALARRYPRAQVLPN